MKKIIHMLVIFFLTSFCAVRPAFAQADEIAQLLLNVEKLSQFKGILSDMKKGYEILNGGYNTIKDLSQGNFSLHKTFLDGLMAVSPEVRNYRKVAGIIDYQVRLMKEYRNAFNHYKAGGWFRPEEIQYMGKVYDNLFKSSLMNLDELAMVITANQLRMSDDERLKSIDRIYADMEDKMMFLKHFNSENSVLELQREKEGNDIMNLKVLQGAGD